MYRQRFSKNPDVFIFPRIAILDAVFPAWWTMRYKEWLRDPSKIPEGTYKYYIGERPKNSPPGKQWGRDVDTLYSVMFVGDCHWVLMAISIPDRTIKIYDSSTNSISKETIKEAAMPIAHMLPYVLHAFADDEVKQVMDKSMYSIEFVTDGVPQSKPPHGDCGIYAVKFLECLVMGVAFADKHLRDSNMKIMRRKLAAEMYDETRQIFEAMRLPYMASPARTGKSFPGQASPASFHSFFSLLNFFVIFTSASSSSLYQGNTCFGLYFIEVNTMEFPRSLFSDETRPDPSNSINYSSTFKTVKAVKDVVSADVWEYVENSPLGVIIKYVNLKFAWTSILVHYILSRQLYCKKRHELWFLIEEQPALFSLFEFEDITGLNCDPIPDAMVVEDVEESNRFWALFKLRRPRSTPSAEDILELCRSPDVCRSWSRGDQIRLCYLAILTGGLLALDRREAIPPAKAKLLMDLETFEQYPWGRVSFVELVHQIKTATESGNLYVHAKLERSSSGLEQQDKDPEIDNLLEFLRQHKSLSTITWQALPVYPFTPVKCNKRVASQRKSKKSKKVASSEQENKADGGEISSNIAENKDQVESDDEGRECIIQRRQTPRHDFQKSPRNYSIQQLSRRVGAMESCYGPLFATLQSVGVFTLDNLASRVAQLEEFHQVKTLAHDRFSNTKLPAKPAILEDSIGEPSVQVIGGPQDPGKEERHKKTNQSRKFTQTRSQEQT
ncbi:ULP_PROTEASE domain-containing protein [Raphanus sativus]|nr:ULP_PROTEASE domain-containing protein [Raphanus sativus]